MFFKIFNFCLLILLPFGQSQYCTYELTSPTGEIKSPNYPNNYYSNQRCSWLIMTTPRHKIRVVFHEFKLEGSDKCSYDSVTIYDGGSKDSNMLHKFCDVKIPPSVLSPGNKIYVEFQSDGGVTNKGFNATYTTEGNCTYEIDVNRKGEIYSPYYPNNYTSLEDCAWLFTAPEGRTVELEFNTFDLQQDDECQNDWIAIYNGNSYNAQLLGKFCGSALPQNISSSGDKMYMTFHSDDSVSGQGFNATYKTGKCRIETTSGTGFISSPNYPNEYPSMDECEWHLNVGYGRKIKLDFETFNLQADRDCNMDWVAIYNGNSKESPLLGKFCGTDLPHAVISSDSSLLIVFKSDGTVQGNGFKAEYTSGSCIYQKTSLFGEITSPNYPYSYPSNANCEWLLTISPGHTFRLIFEELQLEGSEPCGLDWIAIYDGPNKESTMLGKFCGNSVPSPVLSSGNELYLWFRTDGSVQKRGFKIKYVAEGNCTYHITSGLGEIKSPNFPANYPNMTNCEWLITTISDRKIRLDFNTLQLQQDEECDSDWVTIYDGESSFSPMLGKYCGSELPERVQSSGSKMLVLFHSDESVEGQGFSATHRSEGNCSYEVRLSSGEINSPFYPENYISMEDCSWLLITNPGTTYKLEFQTFDLQPDDNCQYDWVAIYDGNSSESVPLGKFCGNELPLPIISSGINLYIVFHSDASVQGRGFSARYQNGNCLYHIAQPFGEISSPNYPNNFPRGSKCTWMLTTTPGHIIKMEFKEFELQDCSGNQLAIYDGYNTSVKLGQYCGNTLPSPVLSTDNILVIEFMTGYYSTTGKGFKIIHTTEGNCTFHITDKDGVISSPNYPNNYPNMTYCAWFLATVPQRRITLIFERFDLQSSTTCEKDRIVIYDGNSTRSRSLGKFCGNESPPPIVSSGTKLYVVFTTDGSIQDNGFQATYRAGGKCLYNITNAIGDISSPFYPKKYQAGENCGWIFSTTSHKQIMLDFKSFDLESTEGCVNDWIAFYDGNTTEAELLGKFCGSELPPIVISSSNLMYMTFKSNSAEEGKGFEARYIAGDCFHYFKTFPGEITTPNFPYSYPNLKDCVWIFTANPGNVIKLEFGHFELEVTNDCMKDYVAIYDGHHTNSTMLGKFCGRKIPPPVISFGNKMIVVFKSDYSNQYNGFKATYSTGSCLHSLISPTGEITSPEFPDPYPSMQDCSWIITTNPGEIIKLDFNEFRLERSKQCMHDWVAIYDGYNTESSMLGKFCDSKLPHSILSSGNNLFIEFKTDGSVQRTGFKITYTTVSCSYEMNAPFGTIKSPNYPNTYPSSTTCKWQLSTTPGHEIMLVFSRFYLEYSSSCYQDSVTIFDGDCNGYRQMGKFCGASIPNPFFSNDNSMCVIFQSNDRNENIGFLATYKTIGQCAYEITNDVGVIRSPNYPNNYPNNAACVWLFTATTGYTIKLDFGMFALEETEECEYDSVTIYDGESVDSPMLGKFCGNKLPPPIISSGNKMYLQFQSDKEGQKEGFEVKFITGDCMHYFTDYSGVISSPEFPDDYPRMESCDWLLRTTGIISLQFDSFELQHDEECEKDWIAIYDGDSTDSPLLGKFCGRERPPEIYSTGSSMYIEFISDDSVQEQGFSATYVTTSSSISTKLIAGVAVGVILFITFLVITVYFIRKRKYSDSQKGYNYSWWQGKSQPEEASLCGN